MNPAIRRALAIRGGLALALFALLVVLAATSSPQFPWPVFLTFFTVVVTLLVIWSVFCDRKLAVRAGRGTAPWTGSLARWTQQFAAVSIERAGQVALQAVANVGGRGVEFVDASTAIGWIGLSWTNMAERQEYELAVVLAPDSNGGTCFTCCARPRWSLTMRGGEKSLRLSESLGSEVERLVAGPS